MFCRIASFFWFVAIIANMSLIAAIAAIVPIGVWQVGHAETSEPCEQVNESSSLLGAYVQKDRYNKALYEGPKLMRKYDKAKCRAQLSCNSGGAAKKNIAISQCQQKLKKTSLSDKISSALKRR